MPAPPPAPPPAPRARLACTIIPIQVVPTQPAAPLPPTQLNGDARRLQAVLDALVADVQTHLPGLGPTARWLRALRLGEGEAHVLIAPDLGHDSLESAEIAFDTLRRLLPDTDIYVSAASA